MPYSDRATQLAAQQKHYQDNKSLYRKHKQHHREINRQWIAEYRATLRCSQCPENHPACLDFHHHNDDKDKGVSKAILDYSLERLKKEVAKCIILCSNCHRKLHDKERQRSVAQLDLERMVGDHKAAGLNPVTST